MANTADDRKSEFFEKRKILHDRIKAGKQDEVIDWYHKEAVLYDEQFEQVGFAYIPDMVAMLKKYSPGKDSYILDAFAGTGKVGMALTKAGYENMDALDGAVGMLALAKEKKIYTKFIHTVVNKEKVADVADGTYDAVCMGGSFGPKHSCLDTLPTLLRMLKPDGVFIFNYQQLMADQYDDFSYDSVDKRFAKFENEGICKVLEKIPCFHRTDEPGYLAVLQRGRAVIA